MNGRDYLVNTNILIYIIEGDETITEFLQGKEVFISFISEMELLSKPSHSAEIVKVLQSMIDRCVLVEFNHEIKSEAIKLRRNYRLKLPDAIVAATAIYLRLPLMTADKQFKKIPDLEVLSIN